MKKMGLFICVFRIFSIGTIWAINFSEINAIFEERSYARLEEANAEIISFLKSNESIGVDIKKYLPFINIITSDDGRIMVFFWDDQQGGTMRYINTMIRYIPLDGSPYTIQSNEISNKFYGAWIDEIYILSQDVYLIRGTNKGSTRYFFTEYHTIAIENNKIVPYRAFNGETSLREHINIFEDRNEYKYTNLPKTIEIFIDSKRLLFIFDGQQYTGDYRGYNF
jgi:hypothetical protein